MATLPDPIDHRAEAERALGGKAWTPGEHLLAAIHDLLDERMPKPERTVTIDVTPDDEPCGYGCNSVFADCAIHGPAADPEPESVTVTLPRAVVESAPWREVATRLRDDHWVHTADLLDALADALDGQR